MGGKANGIPRNLSVPFVVVTPRNTPVFNETSMKGVEGVGPARREDALNSNKRALYTAEIRGAMASEVS